MAKNNVWEFEITCADRHNRNFEQQQKWVKIETAMVHSAKWELLSLPARVLWVTMLSHGASVGSKFVRFTELQLSRMVRIKTNRVPAVIRELIEVQWLRIVSAEKKSAPLLTDERTNGRLPVTPNTTTPGKPKIPLRTSPARTAPKTAAVWDAYRTAFTNKYKIEPLRDARVNGQLAKIVDRVGAEDAPKLATFYLRCTDGFYQAKKHTVDFLLKDIETLRVRMLNNETNPQSKQSKNHHQELADAF